MKHLARAGALLAVVFTVMFWGPRLLPIPEFLTDFGFHSKNIEENETLWASLPIQYVSSSICANCHQPRTAAPEAGSGDFKITSPYWGPYHGPQAAMLLGVAGSGADTGKSIHYSLVDDGCPVCHMADAYGKQAGDHTWTMAYEYHGHETPNLAGCESCHSGIESFDRNGVQTEVKALLDELRELLIADGVMNDTDHAVPGTYSAERAGALYNYLFVLEGRSDGVHNPAYAKALLESAIEALK